MKRLIARVIAGAAVLAAAGCAQAGITLTGGTFRTFSGYDVPPVLTDPQSTGLENAVLVGGVGTEFTATFLGKEAAHINQFWVNGALVFNNLASAPTTYGPFAAGNPISFQFKDTATGSVVGDGGAATFASYVVLGTQAGGVFTPYTKGGQFDFVLGFNDGATHDADFDDLVVGFKVTAVPEPETYALMLAGLGVVGFVARRRRNV